MRICFLNAFHAGSHQAFAEGLQQHSSHDVELLTLPGRHWKWRMHGAAVALARQFLALEHTPELILATDMLDLTAFLALTRSKSAGIPVAIYFHENQLTYPWSPTDADVELKRDNHYGWINYTSALAADAVLFNSGHHKTAFLDALPAFLKSFPDARELTSVADIATKSQVLPLGLNLEKFDAFKQEKEPDSPPLILWNHRWEFDKNPEAFFQALFVLADRGLDFEVAIVGESYRQKPAIFEEAKSRLGPRIVQFGYADSFEAYARWLWQADIVPVTSNQDFFGISAVEAMYCGCTPLLPNRLAFPEHLPFDGAEACYYNESESLVDRLAASLAMRDVPGSQLIREFVARYDWKVSIANYDSLLSTVTSV